MMDLYPLTTDVNTTPIPVFPEVHSTNVVF